MIYDFKYAKAIMSNEALMQMRYLFDINSRNPDTLEKVMDSFVYSKTKKDNTPSKNLSIDFKQL